MKFNPHNYQLHAIDHVLEHPYCALFKDMGLGKTVSTLTAIDRLVNSRFEADKVLIIAPKRVAQDTWPTEIAKWDHTRHLTHSLIMGTPKQRIAALKQQADIYIINRENIPWLCAHLGGKWPFDTVVIDESSSFKNPSSQRFKALRKMRAQMKRVVLLSGTPAPNGLIDLWPQIYLLDQGKRLGETITMYRDRYFKPDKQNGMVVYSYALRDKSGGEKEIHNRISDICISMKASDYLELPGRLDQDVKVQLPEDVMKAYKKFEEEQVMRLMNGTEITAVNAPALMNKLLQFSNGAVYNELHEAQFIHDTKIERVAEDLESCNGNPFLLFYQFQHDLDRLLKYFKAYNPQVIKSTNDLKAIKKQMEQWENGKIPLLLAYPDTAGQGLNLQYGGHMMGWFGLTWKVESYMQSCARLDRQGQTKTVINRRYICENTVDMQVMPRLSGKMKDQEALMQAVKAIVDMYQK